MNTANLRDRDRLSELLADEASAALAAEDTAELKSLLDRNPGVARDELLQIAALAQVAFLHRARRSMPRSAHASTIDRMPAGLRERLASQGEALAIRQRGPAHLKPVASTGDQPAPTPSPPRATVARQPRSRVGATAGLGWALAAALAVALVIVRTGSPDLAPARDTQSARANLITDAPDAITLPWAPPTAQGYESVRGDVVWSQSRQQGYLRLANMPVNDPARTQYQLWIVDPERDSKHPVDGGVFNVSASGEVVIPIQAKLQILSPAVFAITAEQPGGVVVSAGPLLVVAAI